jgi:DNA-binding transcriptional ArsR family regulator
VSYSDYQGGNKDMSTLSVGASHNVINPNSLTFEERQRQLENQDKKEKEARERAKKSPFKNFVQVNKEYYKAEDWLMSKSPIAYRIFKFLINGMDDYNAVICSYKVLQENFGVSQDTVRRAIKILKEKKYIDVYKSGTSNVYAINKQIVWNSWGTNYDIAKFGANIILSESEQEESVKAQIKAIRHKEITLKED